MKIDIRGHRIEVTEALRTHIERRLQFALGRFGARVTAVTVTTGTVATFMLTSILLSFRT